ncbi:hypothetical protein BpHYR1_046816 [Brachionus plicatilis]|uniref:Uncharacterized protein n=1 Tax=Brachionus plicatilis TaxID=10195 RepID=A0A3M7RP13_BRAPC|nr:hypothetical protein BpHYR1_046816 [Brachionus plicatilis]
MKTSWKMTFYMDCTNENKKNENRISNDILTDTVAALIICQKMCYSSNDITGYIRIWKKIQNSNPVWCFNALELKIEGAERTKINFFTNV